MARELRAQPGPGWSQKAVSDLLEEKKALEKELAPHALEARARARGSDLARRRST